MSKQPFRIESVAQIHAMMGGEKPKHPLLTLVEPTRVDTRKIPALHGPLTTSLYSINLKNGRECQIVYGRQPYDFQEGTMLFLAPDQVITPVSEPEDRLESPWHGWSLLFHPDLLRQSPLGEKIHEYSFFSYDSHEALHLSAQERKTVTQLAYNIQHEVSQNMDEHSQELILSHIELLLNYCKRFYSRQFLTRTHANKDVLVRFEAFLRDYFEHRTEEHGLPSVAHCAKTLGYSPDYLSDLLKKETGKNAQEHIHTWLIEKAKNLLLGTKEPIYRVAHSLGFAYPQHFSKLFKSKTGMSPTEYRS